MQATFYGPNKTQKILQQITPKDEKEVVKEAEMEFKRRQGFKRIFPSIDYGYYK